MFDRLREHPNALIADWGRQQLNPRRLHRSSLLGSAIFLAAVVTGLLVASSSHPALVQAGIDPETAGYMMLTVYSMLLFPLMSVVPYNNLLRLIRRWDRQSRIEPLLVTPVTSPEWFKALLVRTTLPCLLTWECLGILTLLWLLMLHGGSWRIEDEVGWLLFTLCYIPLQTLWSFAITATFATRRRSFGLAGLLSFLSLTAPFLLWLAIVYVVELLWGPLLFICVVKAVITVPLLLGLRKTLPENLRMRAEG